MTTNHIEVEMPLSAFYLIYINCELNIMSGWIALSDWCQWWIQPRKAGWNRLWTAWRQQGKEKNAAMGPPATLKGGTSSW